MYELKEIFKRQGGWALVKQYLKSGVFFLGVIQLLVLEKNKVGLEILRLSVGLKIKRKLEKEYKQIVLEQRKNNGLISKNRCCSNKVWVCWLQGMENAPELVQVCYKSLHRHLKDKKIVLITENNYKDFVTFPEHIQKKFDTGVISKTHFSDLLRLELLINYGGTWIDATVFCSGRDIPDYMLNSDLFLYQCLKPGKDGHACQISSWFITSCANHPILLLTRELLYEYWKKYNYMKDYFLLHDFFQIAIEAYPDEWRKVLPFSNSIPHILLLRLFDEFNQEVWDEVTRLSAFHKLSYKSTAAISAIGETYYDNIVSMYI